MIDLLADVTIPVIDNNRVRRLAGVVIGRTLEQSPRYDVRLPGGKIVTVETGVAVPLEHGDGEHGDGEQEEAAA